MRYTIGEVVRRPTPSRIAGWWYDLPARSGRWWREVLFEKGQGWLRWGFDTGTDYRWSDEPQQYVVAPPLRRLWCRLWWPRWSIESLVSEDRRRLWR